MDQSSYIPKILDCIEEIKKMFLETWIYKPLRFLKCMLF